MSTKAEKTKSRWPWLKPALHSRQTLKTSFRCCVMIAVTMILMVANKTANTMGQVAFFGVIVAVLVPPYLPLSVFVIASMTLLFGMLLGWAWGNAAMASALSVRSSSLLAQQEQKLKESLDPNLPIARQTEILIYHGLFLDPGSSAVYGVFIFIGTFAFGALRAFLPNLALLGLFGIIVLDVVCTTGPLFPTAEYTLAKLFIIPTCFYVASAIASSFLIFPESLNHFWLLSLLETFWTPVLELIRLQNEALDSVPSEHEKWSDLNARGIEYRFALVNAIDPISSQIHLIDLDLSIGRLGPADLKKINSELKSIVFRAGGLHSFQAFVNDSNIADQINRKEVEDRLNQGDRTSLSLNKFQILLKKIREREEKHGHKLDSLVPIVASSSYDLRASCESSVVAIVDWLKDGNGRRWTTFFFPPTEDQIDARHKRLINELQRLQNALDEFRNVHRVKLVQPYEKFFDPETRKLVKKAELFTSRSLYICFVFIDTLDAFADVVIRLLKTISAIDAQRPKAKVWYPWRISKVTDNITNGQYKGAAGPLGLGTVDDPVTFNESNRSLSTKSDEEEGSKNSDEKETQRLAEPLKKRNPDALLPTTTLGKVFVNLGRFFVFFKSPEGIFALRTGIASVALWIPAVCSDSAWFYQENKGVWALIMAQTGLAMYAGDQIAGFVVRLLGTIIGALIGVVVWYIGAGLGHGNAYGIVVATTIALAPFLFLRIAGPPSQAAFWVMIAVTAVLVTGYSWVNANQPVVASPGVGISVGWKRGLLVIIGFTVAFIVMLFPNPISSRVLVRKTLAAVIGEVGNIFGGEIEAFLAEEARARNGSYKKVRLVNDNKVDEQKISPKERRVRKIGKRVVAVSTRLKFIFPSLSSAKFEPHSSGAWPHSQYKELFNLLFRALGSLALLTTSFAKLDTKWCSALVHKTPYMNPNFLSDIFTTVTILSNTLMNGQSLPAHFPKLRDRLIYHEYYPGRSVSRLFPPPVRPADTASAKTEEAIDDDSTYHDDDSTYHDDGEIEMSVGPGNVDGSSIGIDDDELTLDVLSDEQLPAYSTAIVALSSLISRIDEMIGIVSTLCGEATFQGYESLQRDYLDKEEKTIGGSCVGAEN